MIKKKGFTLIELLIVVGVTGLIMAAIIGIMMQVFKSKNKMSWNEEIESNGTWILAEIRKNILESSGESMICDSSNHTGISMVNLRGVGETTYIGCNGIVGEGNGIASNSANLVKDTLMVAGCDSFVNCDRESLGGTDYRVTKVDISFELSPASIPVSSPDYIRKTFQGSVVVRN